MRILPRLFSVFMMAAAWTITRDNCRQMKYFVNGLLMALAILATTVAAEGVTRLIDGLPLFTDWLPNTVDRDVSSKHLDEIPRAAGVSRSWFFSDPPPLPNRREVPPEWVRQVQAINQAPQTIDTAFRPAELFKAWNSQYANAPCDSPLLRQAPGHLYLYQSLDGSQFPIYRFLPNVTTPLGLVTNQLGWRGPPVEVRRGDNTVRIVFVGASTTVNSHHYPYSYPEFIGHWLNLWAAAHKINVRFEALNAGRESIRSSDIEAIVRKEILPLRPDLVVYYEGANQFDLKPLLTSKPVGAPLYQDYVAVESAPARWLRAASNRLGLARRVQSGLGSLNTHGQGEEWPRPDHPLVWPQGLDEDNPDLSRPDLPVNLSTILGDFDRMRVALGSVDSELAISSFVWLARDGMVLDPIRHKLLLEYLNVSLFPFRYRDIERLSNFQNRVFEKCASAHGLSFVDVAGLFPKDPDLLTDAVHMGYGGVRLHAWIVFQTLIPLIERRLAQGAWGQPSTKPPLPESPGLFFTPQEILFNCKSG